MYGFTGKSVSNIEFVRENPVLSISLSVSPSGKSIVAYPVKRDAAYKEQFNYYTSQ